MTPSIERVFEPTDDAARDLDIERRLAALRALMAREGVDLLVAVTAGAPHANGWLRYLTGAEMWGGREFLIVETAGGAPEVIMRSTYDAEWLRLQAPRSTVHSTLIQGIPPVARLVEVLRERIVGTSRVGIINSKLLTPSEDEAIRAGLPSIHMVDLTSKANAIRRLKSPFEIAAIRETGAILTEGMAQFASRARPGRLAAEVAGEVDGYLKGRGCFWGRVKYSLDGRPFTIPASANRTFSEDDVILFQFVHNGPHGYWFELAKVFSFKPLPPEVEKRLHTMERAIAAARSLAVPGGTYSALSEATDLVFTEAGYRVVGKHTFDCHSIGTDESEGSFPPEDDWVFEADMVLGLHPATLVDGGHGFLLCDNVHVVPGGARSLSDTKSFYQEIG